VAPRPRERVGERDARGGEQLAAVRAHGAERLGGLGPAPELLQREPLREPELRVRARLGDPGARRDEGLLPLVPLEPLEDHPHVGVRPLGARAEVAVEPLARSGDVVLADRHPPEREERAAVVRVHPQDREQVVARVGVAAERVVRVRSSRSA
jgi:hypothetical protein